MSFLIDTNVVSEWVKPRPNAGVIDWLAHADEDRIFLSVITLAELRYGIEKMPVGSSRKQRLEQWLTNELPLRFEGRVISIDHVVADFWGKIVASSEAAGRPIGVTDAFIAATVQTHDFTLVTRNVSDFEFSVESILNPWDDST